jgi:hypothetical protein
MLSQFRRYVEARVQIHRSVALSQENTLRYDHKGKGKTVPEGIWDCEFIASLMYIIFTNWVVSVHLCTPAVSIPGSRGVPIEEEAGGVQAVLEILEGRKMCCPSQKLKQRFLRFSACGLVTTLTVLSRFFRTEDSFIWPSHLHSLLPKARKKLLHKGGRTTSRHITLRSRCFWDRSGTEVSAQPLTARARPPIYLRGPAIQFHKQGWRVRQDKGKVRRATYSHPH